MASASEEVPALPWIPPPRRVTLHLYLPSGEFVAETTQGMHDGIERFVQDLEEGLITPALGLELWNPFDAEFCYLLVWNGMELLDGRVWEDLVDDHGMSVTEPNDIINVTAEVADVNRLANGRNWGT